MLLARVEGNVVATRKHPSFEGWRLVICQPIGQDGTPEGSLGFPLQAALKDLRSEPPQDASDLLPFGADWGGNYYCIAVAGGRRGRVFRLDHEVGTTADEADSFTDFLRQVQ